MQLVFKDRTKLGNDFPFRVWISKDLISSVVCKFHCGLCKKSYYGEWVIHLNVAIGKHISSSLLNQRPIKNIIGNYILNKFRKSCQKSVNSSAKILILKLFLLLLKLITISRLKIKHPIF